MFASFMVNTWWVATMVAVIAGVVGFFVVLRGQAFAAHAIPNGAFAGAAGASLIGADTLLGLGVFAVASSLGLGALGRRGRKDAVTALSLSFMLALGAAFLSRTSEYEPEIFSLLFGEVLGVSTNELWPVFGLTVGCLVATAVLYRPLLLTSVLPEVAEAKGMANHRLDMMFLVVVGLTTAMTVPVVGALLIFTLLIGPPAAARAVATTPGRALLGSVVASLVTVWVAIASAYESNLPIGFYVGMISAAFYTAGRVWSWLLGRGHRRPLPAPLAPLGDPVVMA